MNYKKMSEQIINWLFKIVRITGFKRVVLGLSGGVDSSLSATLAVKALGRENVFVVILPYGKMSSVHVKDAKEVADWLRIPKEKQIIYDIKPGVDVIAGASPSGRWQAEFASWRRSHDSFKADAGSTIRRGNIMARVRMIYLFDLAKKFTALVCGTENKTEHYLGYFTRFGDAASDLEPIQSLYKTQVRSMAKFMDIPEKIISKAPTAGLWDQQTDEGEFGFSYEQADQVLYYHFDKSLSITEIVEKGIEKRVVESVLLLVKQNEFKHILPYKFQI